VLKILVLGGTRFFGSFFTELALARGHDVSVMHRGQSNAGDITGAHTIIADRCDGHARLAGMPFDAVLDTSGFVPAVVGDAVRALEHCVPRYVFVSSVSAYADPDKRGIVESDALAALPAAVAEIAERDLRWPMDMAHYGGLKAACERRVVDGFGPDRSTIVRPGLIAGPRDPTFRFNYWVSRLATQARVLAPAPPEAPVQVIDARDLAAFALGLVERKHNGIFNATGDSVAIGALLEQIRIGVASKAQLAWVASEFLLEQKVEPWSELPLWLPAGSGSDGFQSVSNRRAHEAGLELRPVRETARDAWAWMQRTPPSAAAAQAVLSPARERELLAQWDESTGEAPA
jgi:2'-hydroxyisoflavone reductase